MSTKATQDAIDGASTQVSLAEYLSGDGEDPGEPPESNESEVAQRGDTRDDLDYSQEVFTSEHGDHYHAMQYGICACPNLQGTKVTLEEAVKRGYLPCGVCHPVDYRRKRPDKQPTTVKGL